MNYAGFTHHGHMELCLCERGCGDRYSVYFSSPFSAPCLKSSLQPRLQRSLISLSVLIPYAESHYRERAHQSKLHLLRRRRRRHERRRSEVNECHYSCSLSYHTVISIHLWLPWQICGLTPFVIMELILAADFLLYPY